MSDDSIFKLSEDMQTGIVIGFAFGVLATLLLLIVVAASSRVR